MDALNLARLQFGVTTSIHWLFVLVTLGLICALLYFQTRATFARKPENRELYFRMTRFWGLMYVINYALGIASGIVMEFQFGTQWSGLSHLVGGVFGAPLALETIIAFVAESTFLALWIFGWHKLPRWAHLAALYVVAITAFLSAFWVLVANGFMQNPVGYEMRDGVAVLTDVGAVFSNPSTWWAFAHILGAALTVGGIVILGTSAWHLFRRTEEGFFVRSFRVGWTYAFVGVMFLYGTGFPQQGFVESIQPMKFAKPDAVDDVSADLVAKFGSGDYRLPESVTGMFDDMMNVANVVFTVLFMLAPLILWRLSAKARWVMPIVLILVPLPFVGAVFGWVLREMGRQPWVVYGVEKTSEAFGGATTGSMWTSFIGFTVVLGSLLLTAWWLMFRHGLRGPKIDVWQPDPDTATDESAGLLIPQGTR